MEWVINKRKELNNVSIINKNVFFEVKNFHESIPEYKGTPTTSLKQLADYVGLSEIYVKDESYRFGLNSFKILGASYAMGKYIANKLGKDIVELPYGILASNKTKRLLGNLTFVAATDGNHGKGVAWMAKKIGHEAIIYMPKGSTKNRIKQIEQLGAKVNLTQWNYDHTVRYVAEEARKNDWEIIQDTAWEGYTEVPMWIMQGYSTMAQEVVEQLKGQRPTHVFLQAGVGAFGAVITEIFLTIFEKNPPKIIVVEPEKADCFYQSIQKGEITSVTGELDTVMAGLACGEPNPVAWGILKNCADVFISASDWMTARGMRIMGNPLKGDPKVISGESGAVTGGVLSVVMMDDQYKELKETLELDEKSKVLLFSTEGNTDTDVYRRIVWDGDYQSIIE